jgi:ribosomal protein S18 acetylase RimI-like enzyme
MFRGIFQKWLLFRYGCQTNGLGATIRRFIYVKRKLILLSLDLKKDFKLAEKRVSSELSFLEVGSENFKKLKLSYPVTYRRLRAKQKLAKGYRCFVVHREMQVQAELWFTGNGTEARINQHPDLKWLEIRLGRNSVYTNDLFIIPSEQGTSLAALLWQFAIEELRKKKIREIIGYVWADNFAALWLYRTLRFKEIGRFSFNRYVFFTKRNDI